MLKERIVKGQPRTRLVQPFTMFFMTFWTMVNTVITFELLPVITLAMNTAAMGSFSFQHDDLTVTFFLTFWTAVSTVITFKLLPVITFLASLLGRR